ncbi:MAG: TonB-dependent receptor [candidate division Zixibacteria bacterium]
MYLKPAFRLAAIFVAILVASAAFAGTTGKIAGKILDKDTGEPLPGVSVLISGTTIGAATNIQGEFFIINVPPGTYDLKASLVGYGPVEVTNVKVSIDLTSTMDVELSTETIDMGTITVEAIRPLIEKDITSSRTTIAPTQITDSAVDGLVNSVLFTAGSSIGSFRGGRGNQGEVIYMLDGVNVAHPLGETRVGNNPGAGSDNQQNRTASRAGGSGSVSLATIIPNEAVAEAEVLTGGFGAEYPNVQSAIINVVTKDGGEKYSGKIKSKSSMEVFFGSSDYEDDVFRVPVPAADPLDPADTVLITESRPAHDEFNRSDFYDVRQHEFAFGGPIPISDVDIPGKLSFFTSGIYSFNRSYQDERSWSKSQSVQAKLTYQLSSAKKITISGLRTSGSNVGWNRSRMLFLTWGEPTYYHRSDAIFDTVSNEWITVERDSFYTPYSWILAPGHTEGEMPNDLVDHWIGEYGNDTWDVDSVAAYFATNFAGASYSNWANMPDSIRDGAADYIENLGYASRYTDYDMANTIARPESWSSEFSVKFSNNISSKSFYTLRYSRFLTAQRVRVYDPWDGHPLSAEEFADPRIGAPPITGIQSAQLRANPMYISRFRQDDKTITQSAKGDFTSQINSTNLIKFGGEISWYDLLYDYRSYASGGNEYNSQYHEKPFKIGVYAQDKIETEGMIVNVGLRYDFFDPKTVVPFNFFDPLNAGYDNVNDERYTQTWDLDARLKNAVPAKKKQQLSPRVGISYPITEKDVLHVTYGHYFQLPVFDDFYTNHSFDLRGAFKYIGNPNLSEQKTIAYEAGIEHGVNDFLKLSIVGFYKDIADLVNHVRFQNEQTGGIFWIYGNSDYARVKGFEITFTQRPWNNFSGVVSYSYQIARGRASSKTQTFNDDYNNRKPRTEDFPLDWDQRHSTKVNFNYRIPEAKGAVLGDWGFDWIFAHGTGRPYTGTATVVPPNLPDINNERFSADWRMDFRVDKGVNIFNNYNLNAFVEIRNITDQATIIAANDLERYELTGDPMGQFGDPSVYSTPRRILLGMQLSF